MAKTKRYFSQVVQEALQRNFRNSDFKIREQIIWARMDQLVNEMAKASYFDNWAFSGGHADEQFITTWTDDAGIEVIDPANGVPSYITLPANYADLPRNGGIEEIWPLTFEEGLQHPVVIMSHRDFRRYLSNKAGNMQGRLAGYCEGRNKFVFNKANVGTDYSEKMGVRLVGINSQSIGLDVPFPIPANKEKELTDKLIEYFMIKQNMPLEAIRDGNNQPVAP